MGRFSFLFPGDENRGKEENPALTREWEAAPATEPDWELNYYSFSETGPSRKQNEDCIRTEKQRIGSGLLVLAVADGMGGHNAGEVASRIATDTICSYISGNISKEDPIPLLKGAFREANARILDQARANPHQHGMGTTATVLLVTAQKFYLGHVGDSRLYHYSAAGLKQLSKDFTLVQQLEDEGKIKAGEKDNHPQKNVLTQALGTNEKFQMQVEELGPAHKNDRYFLCSDGVYDIISREEIEQLMHITDGKFIVSLIKGLGGLRVASDNFSGILLDLFPRESVPITKEHDIP